MAIAGDDDKLRWCGEIGFDTAINYKKATDLTAAVKESCPQGVDIFFDNTAGPIHDAVMKNLSIGARVIICGRVALAGQFGKPDIGERFMGHLIVTRASIHGFLVFDWWHRRDEARDANIDGSRQCAGAPPVKSSKLPPAAPPSR